MRFSRIILGIFSWFPFVLLFIFMSIPLILLLLYKLLVTRILRRLFRKDLAEPITGVDHLCCVPILSDLPLGSNAYVSVADGNLDVDRVCARLSDVVEDYRLHSRKKNPNCDRLTSVTPSFWLGYPFWTKVKEEFNARNHLKIMVNAQGDVADINQTLREWIMTPFKRNTPLWDVLIVTGIKDDQGSTRSYFGFRIHHVIGDGYSMKEFMDKLFDEDFHDPLPLMGKTPKNFSIKKLFWLPLGFFSQMQMTARHSDYFSTKKAKMPISMAMSSVSLEDLKTIRRELSFKVGAPVTFNTMLAFILGRTLRKAFVDGDLVGDVKKLKDIKVGCGLPRNAPHPENEFCNHWDSVAFTLSLKSERPLENLKNMVRLFSDELEIYSDFIGVYTLLPRRIFEYHQEETATLTIMMGNLPGPLQPVHLCGKRIIQTNILPSPQMRHFSFGIIFYSYNNQVFITLVANEKVFDGALAEKLVSEYFQDEVKNLLENGIGDETFV